jgi:Transcriptional regulator, contains sigma factor-related N-terminal domain
MVTITINHPHARVSTLEQELQRKFEIERCRVVRMASSPAQTLGAVGRQAADYLSDTRPIPRTVAMGWGRTIAAVAHAMRNDWGRGVSIIQVDAAGGRPGSETVNVALSLMAKRGHGSIHMLDTPLVLRTKAEADRAHSVPATSSLLDSAANAEVLMFSPIVGPHGQDNYMAPSGPAVGSVFGHWITSDGNIADEELDQRTMALSLARAKGIRDKVVVCCGEEKWDALTATLAAGLADTLITDSDTAAYLVDA